MNRRWRLVSATLAFLAAARTALAHTPAQEMADAANNFLATLTPEQKAKASFSFTSDEREHWHFTPGGFLGLPLKEMTVTQRHLASALLSTALSQRGFLKASTIMSLEQTLGEIEGSVGRRDPELYYVSIFGTPGGKAPWSWRWEGHHLSLNFTLTGNEVVTVTPEFMGSNPAEVREGPRKDLRILGTEMDLGRKLMLALSADQQRAAIFSAAAPSEIVTGNQREALLPAPAGLTLAKMTDAQRAIFAELLQEHIGRLRGELAGPELKKIQQVPPEKIYFAWAGPLEPDRAHYYRIQGPTFLIEYDNSQNNANHIHTVWRDLEHDFGRDPLKEHYAAEHQPPAASGK